MAISLLSIKLKKQEDNVHASITFLFILNLSHKPFYILIIAFDSQCFPSLCSDFLKSEQIAHHES